MAGRREESGENPERSRHFLGFPLVFGALLDRFVGGGLPAPQAEPERETVGAS
jgi:hypothetical protein